MAELYKTRDEVTRACLAKKLHWIDGMNLIKSLPKSWLSKEWKSRREARIADHCAACSVHKDDGAIMVMQHTWRPKPWADHLQHHRALFLNEWAQEHPFVFDPRIDQFKYEFETRKLCPKCNGGTHRSKNEKIKLKKCISTQNKVLCGHEFYEHEFIEGPWSLRTCQQQFETFINSRTWRANQEWQEEFWQAKNEEIREAAAMDAFRESLRYTELRIEDTKTLCRPCAAKEDYPYIRANEIEKMIIAYSKAGLSQSNFDPALNKS